MSARTKDYVAHAKHLGRVQYVATIIAWDEDERHYLADRTFPNLGLAKRWAVVELPKHVKDDDVWRWCEIRRGKWVADSFNDYDGYGRVQDATFEHDEDWECSGDPLVGGGVAWTVNE